MSPMKVRDVMTRPAISVTADTPIKDVAELLVAERISGLPVVGDDGRVLGVVSEADLLVKEQDPRKLGHGPLGALLGDPEAERKFRARSAGEAMTAPAITIDGDVTVQAAAKLMIERKVNRLPVVGNDRLIGIVTRADLVRAFVRSDAELELTIRSEVLLRALWLDPADFEVTVEKGVATISGQVERKSTAVLIERVVGMVPGVIGVVCEVAWSWDDAHVQPPAMDPRGPIRAR